MKLSVGDLVLVSFPFTDLSSEKRRPCLVVAAPPGGADVIICAVTSRPQSGAYDVAVEPTADNGLKVRSWIQFDKIATIALTIVAGRLGAVAPDMMDEGRRLMTRLFDLDPATAPSP